MWEKAILDQCSDHFVPLELAVPITISVSKSFVKNDDFVGVLLDVGVLQAVVCLDFGDASSDDALVMLARTAHQALKYIEIDAVVVVLQGLIHPPLHRDHTLAVEVPGAKGLKELPALPLIQLA
jgi:hypothetical protein